MFEEIKAIVAENLGADKASITPETSFSEDLKADSLDLFEMVMAFEEHFGVDIPAEDLEQLKTVGDVMSYVESHKAKAEDKNRMQTRVTGLLKTEYPIIQGGMAWVADYHLAAAVSNGGGLGMIGAANAPAEWVAEQIREVRKRTDRPFGVNIMLMSPHADEVARTVARERVPVVTTGAGNPEQYMTLWKEKDIRVIPVIASVAMAKRMEKCGADAVVAEGYESGGHVGESTTMTLVPQVCDAVNIPVIAAGGIADGRGIAAALMLGAEGVQMGTRFVVTKECHIHPAYKERILKAKDIDTKVTGRSTGHPVRALRNDMTKRYLELEQAGASMEELEYLTLGALRRAVTEGDVLNGSVMAGQIAGMIHEETDCRTLIRQLIEDAEKRMKVWR